jgi:hypothetical protein
MLNARENPFFPVEGAQDISLGVTNTPKLTPLQRATIQLPSTARVIEDVCVKYKNLDGSVTKKCTQLNNSIDWHLPIFISQSYSLKKGKKEGVKKSVRYKKLLSLRFISFYQSGKNLKIVTKDKLLRSFLLVRPHRIVCDFKRDINMKSFYKSFGQKAIFRSFKIGTHDGYYRVVIELDGYYQYKIGKKRGGYYLQLL